MSLSYLTSLVPNNFGDISRTDLFQCYMAEKQTRKLYMHIHSFTSNRSFRPLSEIGMNTLPEATGDSNSMEFFTNQLNTDMSPPKRLCLQGNCLAQIYHTRLRTGFSTLHLNLYSKHILEHPLGNCGEIEDPFHFFLHSHSKGHAYLCICYLQPYF